MAKRVSRKSHNELLIHKWWVNIVIGLIFLAAAYGLASLAINSGNLLEYLLTAIFLIWGLARLVQGVRSSFDR